MDSLINLLVTIFTMGLIVVLIAFAFILGLALTIVDGVRGVFGRKREADNTPSKPSVKKVG